MTKEAWGFGVEYSDDNFDPAPVRKILGLDSDKSMFMPKEEALRMANLLNRTGNLSESDLRKLKMIKKEVLEKIE